MKKRTVLQVYAIPFFLTDGGYSLLWDETYLYSQCPAVPIWVAQYNSSCDYPDAKIWQYTDKGNVAGVNVNCNYMLGVL